MFGWWSAESVLASRSKRFSIAAFPAISAMSTLSATLRPRVRCSARKMRPIPPSPSALTIRYRPAICRPSHGSTVVSSRSMSLWGFTVGRSTIPQSIGEPASRRKASVLDVRVRQEGGSREPVSPASGRPASGVALVPTHTRPRQRNPSSQIP